MKISVLSLLFVLSRSYVKGAAPLNDMCLNAIEIDATSDIVVDGDMSEATYDQVPFGWCGGYVEGPGVWYKIKDNFSGKVSITLSSCIEGAEYGPYIGVFKGIDCDRLLCVGGSFMTSEETCGAKTTFTFLASEHEPINYYVLVSGYGNIGEFELNVRSDESYFNVIDASNNRFVEVLNDYIWYEDVKSLTDK